jgi:hypothetical protein
LDPNILRIAFLIALFATLILYALNFPVPGLQYLWNTLGRIFLLAAGLATAALFVVLLFRIDPLPYIRQAAYILGIRQLVSFEDAIPPNLIANLAVTKIVREDTDLDGFQEWVVFYKFDKRASSSPIEGVIYDNDRGNPPVIFPYSLRAPDRNYLSEDELDLELIVQPVARDQNGPDGTDIDELVIASQHELTIFRFGQNSEPWDFPRDAPPRYEPIGFFRGSGNVVFDPETRRVTVNDRNGFERSQLAIRSIYELRVDPQTNYETYLDPLAPLGGVGVPRVAAPVVSTVDFYPTPPDDVINTLYPEKIVLAFYAATCGGLDDTLCRNAADEDGWQPRDFLTGDALSAFEANNPAYFGLPNFGGNQNISISQLRYYPHLETDPDLLETGGGRDVVTGEQAQENLVDIIFTVNGAPLETRRYEMRLVEGQWKILRAFRLVTSALASPN